MKRPFVLNVILLAAMMVFLTACATHRIDWNARIGHYTFDQAIVELGPPDKDARLADGRLVAEWITRYSNGGTVIVGGGYYHHPGGIGFVESTGPTYYEHKLRLIFSPQNILTSWSKN